MRRTLALLTSLFIAACGSPSPTPSTHPSPATSSEASPTTEPASPSASPIPAEAGPKKLGVRVLSSDGAFNMTALAYRQPVARTATRPDEQPGYEWGAADVRVCSTKGARAAAISNAPWALVYGGGTRAKPSSTTYQQFPLPEYPVGEEVLRSGRCIRGWITFPVPKGGRPSTIEYATEDGMEFAEWAVPQ